ncbi:D-inositol-3-phosphate glycosyltransferase [Streptomyces sp. AJS327]|uniref:D-inositol-3-phosphate glycosyltransferase n=1 Tax=Streptomyces sp. AJS327 TaxID=2545265 RepID=UPI0015DF7829|nr:D-inositol-3-phosphate glycosyltransferase [Streptomyces sp. AJS327]MBA0053163.1 D-inositol-3-phosphate glycosyltransferase [Streptomyces sp. AJS327]
MSLRIAMLSVHTSPLHQPGTGDAGGMNVYLAELARALTGFGAEVDLFTRNEGERAAPQVPLAPGVTVRHLTAGPQRRVAKEELPARVVEFSLALLRSARAGRPYDVVHSHYWLSGQAGRIAAARWRAPLVHTMHTMARVKNAALRAGESAEPEERVRGEHQVVEAADHLIANTGCEAGELCDLYGAVPDRTHVIRPGVDLRTFHPGAGRQAARARLGLPRGAFVPLFAGRIQPLKSPDVLLRAVAELLAQAPWLRRRTVVPLIGGVSGSAARMADIYRLCAELGVSDVVRFEPALPQGELAHWYRAADVLVMPSRSESFGLAALEAQACGTPVLAASVGGLPTAVWDGVTGFLVKGHEPADYARHLRWMARFPGMSSPMGAAAVRHARGMSWRASAERTVEVYERALRQRRGGAETAARLCPGGTPSLEEKGGHKGSLAHLFNGPNVVTTQENGISLARRAGI